MKVATKGYRRAVAEQGIDNGDDIVFELDPGSPVRPIAFRCPFCGRSWLFDKDNQRQVLADVAAHDCRRAA